MEPLYYMVKYKFKSILMDGKIHQNIFSEKDFKTFRKLWQDGYLKVTDLFVVRESELPNEDEFLA